MHLRDEIITINEGEFYIVPKGVEHKPVAKEEVHILLFEPLSTKHTGDVKADITVETYEEIPVVHYEFISSQNVSSSDFSEG